MIFFRTFVAGAATWFAAVASGNAIFHWFRFPWGWGANVEFILLCSLPPLVVLFGAVLFRWALGADRFRRIGSSWRLLILLSLSIGTTGASLYAAGLANVAANMAEVAENIIGDLRDDIYFMRDSCGK